MIVLLPGLAIAFAAFAALSLRLRSLVSTLLAGYVLLVANIAAVTWGLSPFDWVDRTGLTVAEAVLLAAAAAAWWLRGRPRVSLAPARAAIVEVAREPVTLLFFAGLVCLLAYELAVALGSAPNNWDSLAYHLPRAAAWKQEHGIHWIEYAPTGRMNEFQPLAEQEILFLFIAAGTGVLFALPQYVAQLAILVAVYGASRRLGFERRAAMCGAALLATFTQVILQTSTAQNDLVASSFPVVAACLLLGAADLEAVLAGAALGIGLGVKLTSGLVWPVLAWLAWTRGKRSVVLATVGAAAGFVVCSAWGFVMNIVHTGLVLGHGQGRVEVAVSPSLRTTLHTAARLTYRMLDVGRISDHEAWALGAAGAAAGALTFLLSRRRTVAVAAAVAVPLLTPAIELGLAPVVAWVAHAIHLGVHDPTFGFRINRDSNEDFSAFGAAGALAVFGAPVLAFVAARRDRRQLALALAMPSYVLLLGLYAAYNIFLTRFLLVPVVLTAPLFARFFRGRAATAAMLVIAAATAYVALGYNNSKPLLGNTSVAHPWQLTQADALDESPAQPTGRNAASGLVAYEARVPATACVGAVMDPDEWSYLLFGPKFQHRVIYLASLQAVALATKDNLRYVVISDGANAPISALFTAAGWKKELLGRYWQLVIAPHEPPGGCHT